MGMDLVLNFGNDIIKPPCKCDSVVYSAFMPPFLFGVLIHRGIRQGMKIFRNKKKENVFRLGFLNTFSLEGTAQ